MTVGFVLLSAEYNAFLVAKHGEDGVVWGILARRA